MKDKVKLFAAMRSMAIIALAVIIGFAACDNNGPGETGNITWTAAADGTAGTTTSTKITFTFSAAVSGLTADNITLTNGTGTVTKGAITEVSGTKWELGITVTTPGNVSVKINKDGIDADAQSVTVYKKGELAAHPISGRTSWVYVETDGSSYQVVFSTITGTSGTYQLINIDLSNYDNPTWDKPQGEGNYSWNENAATVTLTATKVGMMDYETFETVLKTKSEVEEMHKETVESNAEAALSLYIDEDTDPEVDRDAAILLWLADENDYNGTNYESIEEYIEGEVAKLIGDAFDPHSYTYIFVNNGQILILLEALPAPIGATDVLATKTLYGTVFDMDEGDMVKDESQSIVFSSSGRTFEATFTAEAEIAIPVTGTYSYNTTTKRVYLKVDTVGGLTPEEYFETAEPGEYSNYPTEDDDRSAQTNQAFILLKFIYDLEEITFTVDYGY